MLIVATLNRGDWPWYCSACCISGSLSWFGHGGKEKSPLPWQQLKIVFTFCNY